MPRDGSGGGGNTQSSGIKQRNGCQMLHLTEENIRFVLLGILLYIYLCLGAFIFQAVEEEAETELRKSYHLIYNEFKQNLTQLNERDTKGFRDTNGNLEEPNGGIVNAISDEDLLRLLYAYGNATKAGVFLRARWDWVGSFHFAWTIVSTIGYGATTPTTTAGQLLIIPYGFFGCAGGLLFFNLFLERIITFLTGCMRCYREIRRKRSPEDLFQTGIYHHQNGETEVFAGRPTSGRSPNTQSPNSASTIIEEKPSVTWVMICLFIMSALMISASAALFHQVEGWTYVESFYFAFVSYSTIGFGDFVTFQQVSYGSLEILYRVIAFGGMVLGCCCIYSLLNVTSIVIKRFLNFIINTLECQCCFCCGCLNTRIRRSLSSRRRSTAQTQRQQYANSSSRSHHQTHGGASGAEHSQHLSIDMEDNERRCSGENLVVLRREMSNKVTMAVMQKRLFETSHLHHRPHSHLMDMETSEFSAKSVGPLAIVSEKFGL